MLRFLATLVLLVGALSILTTASAYKVARPSNPTFVTVVNANQGLISVDAPPSPDTFGWVMNPGSGTVTIDMSKGGTRQFDVSATYTAWKVLKISNSSGSDKTVSVAPSSTLASFGTVTGFIDGTGSPVNSPFTLTSGHFVVVNLSFTTGATTGTDSNVTYVVQAN